MKRIYIIVSSVLVFILLINLFFIGQIRKSMINFQKEILFHQTQLCGNHVEKTIKEYENDLNRIIFNNIQNIHAIFDDPKVMADINRDLEGFYAKYRDLISNISVYNNKNRYLGIYINEDDKFVIDTFSRQQNNKLEPRDIIIEQDGKYFSYFPFFRDNELQGNIVVEVKLDRYLDNVFTLFKIKEILFQWVINTNGEIVFNNFSKDFNVTNLDIIADSVFNEYSGIINHELININNSKKRIISAYYPLEVIKNDLGIVFTMNTAHLLKVFINRSFWLSLVSFLIIIALVFYLLRHLIKSREKEREIQTKLIGIEIIIEQFPIGIMILDKHGIIKNVNRTGQKMLFVEKDEEIIGKSFQHQFLISNKYLLRDESGASFDSNHFIHYEKDGNEIVIYRKNKVIHVAGEELTLSALIDVSPLEKSRKQEAAANNAKSDFLAKMSHEIRTPMNGIIGMTDNLMREKLTKKQTEQLIIIKKSSDLLLNIMNDILDFSKIEAGKMMLEEIPFNLSEEINLVVELFKKQANDKGVSIITNIKPEIPKRIIGDPFRLRQVISNLLSNAVKFTSEGEIQIGVSLMDKYNSTLSLLFYVEDTGIGIAKDRIKKIFVSYEQGEESTSRKYGGTGLGTSIAKQLVELMNGEIWVESPSLNSKNSTFPGSRFSFTIEVFSDEKIQKSYNYSSINHFNQITALILSKEKDNNDNIHRVLDSFGISYNYREYEDQTIDSAIYHIEQKKKLYQLIILKDKPKKDAFALARQLKENNISNHFPVIMISSNDQPGNYLKCKSLGVDYYLIQPYDTNEIFNILKETFTGIKKLTSITPHINKIKSHLKILVADDNIINQRVSQALFKNLGYEIDIAKNGVEAVEMHKVNNYDIIFMDLLMPEKDGFAATREIRSSGSTKTPIIAMTASQDKEKKEESFNAGMNDFITKPVKTESIKHLLIKWFSETL
jgi:signal transduction histidine kinase/DNA-binding response OmpR family regulator